MSGLSLACPVVADMLKRGVAFSPSGETVELHSNLSPRAAETLFELVLDARPSVVVEVGMAFGVASLAVLGALDHAGASGTLISVDPYQSTQWQGCGTAAVARAGWESRHCLVEDYDYLALPRLVENGTRIQFAFIDGWHTFDYTFLDFWYVDRMLDVGGVLGFDDCQFDSVTKVIRFLKSHRRYEEIDVAAAAADAPASIKTIVRRAMSPEVEARLRKVLRRPAISRNRYFRKVEQWEPNWDFYAPF